jgi:hypothetical protein
MCFGGSKKPQTIVETIPQPVYTSVPSRETVVPTLRLNEDEEKVLKLKTRKKRLGTRKLQIPLTPTNPGTGLGIPGRSSS